MKKEELAEDRRKSLRSATPGRLKIETPSQTQLLKSYWQSVQEKEKKRQEEEKQEKKVVKKEPKKETKKEPKKEVRREVDNKKKQAESKKEVKKQEQKKQEVLPGKRSTRRTEMLPPAPVQKEKKREVKAKDKKQKQVSKTPGRQSVNRKRQVAERSGLNSVSQRLVQSHIDSFFKKEQEAKFVAECRKRAMQSIQQAVSSQPAIRPGSVTRSMSRRLASIK